jgi:hypothetical protein
MGNWEVRKCGDWLVRAEDLHQTPPNYLIVAKKIERT